MKFKMMIALAVLYFVSGMANADTTGYAGSLSCEREDDRKHAILKLHATDVSSSSGQCDILADPTDPCHDSTSSSDADEFLIVTRSQRSAMTTCQRMVDAYSYDGVLNVCACRWLDEWTDKYQVQCISIARDGSFETREQITYKDDKPMTRRECLTEAKNRSGSQAYVH